MCLKKKFATKREAARELKRSLIRQARGNFQRRERDSYLCRSCGAYHLTSQERRGDWFMQALGEAP